MDNKYNITWVTTEYFIDVDLPILPCLSSKFNITWYIVLSKNSKIDYKNIVNNKCKNYPIQYEFIQLKNRAKNPKIIIEYYNLLKKIIKNDTLVYYNFGGMPYYFSLFYPLINKHRSVIALHNVTTPHQASQQTISKIYYNFIKKHYLNFQVFSKSQHQILESQHSNKNILCAPLALKDFGSTTINKNKEITFLFFGFIRGYKRVDVLIKAAQNAYEKTNAKFKVCIAGQCDNWKPYQKLIKYNDLFELHIKNIPNEEVPNLFGKAHYFVMPYQDIAQSGAMTVGLQYNLPIIASRLPAFKEFMIDKETGFFIKPADTEDLTEKLLYVLNNHNNIYTDLQNSQKLYVQKTLSLDSIIEKYCQYLISLINSQKK